MGWLNVDPRRINPGFSWGGSPLLEGNPPPQPLINDWGQHEGPPLS